MLLNTIIEIGRSNNPEEAKELRNLLLGNEQARLDLKQELFALEDREILNEVKGILRTIVKSSQKEYGWLFVT